MINQVKKIGPDKKGTIEKNLQKDENNLLININGEKIQNENQCWTVFEEAFHVPYETFKGIYGFNDWITDLEWIPPEKKIILFYVNYEKSLLNDKNFKQLLIKYIIKAATEWWGRDVELYSVEGKKKQFDIYLVEE